MTIVIDFLIAAILFITGIVVFCGNYGIVSIFRRKSVSDKKEYCRAVGKTIAFMGVVIAVSGSISAVSDDGIMEILSTLVMLLGVGLCLLLIWIYGKKYSD